MGAFLCGVPIFVWVPINTMWLLQSKWVPTYFLWVPIIPIQYKHVYLTRAIWLVQQHVDTLYKVFQLNVSRPCFLTSLQGMHKKLGLGMRLASSMKKCWTTQCKILCWLFGLLYKKVNACRLWVTAISVASFPDRFENEEKLMGLVSTVCACA